MMKIACIVFLAVTGLIPAFYGLQEAMRLSRTKFLKTRGKITYSGIADDEPAAVQSTELPMFAPDVRYTFSVEGTEFEGSNLSYAKKASSQRENIERMISPYKAGDTVDVYYDPSDLSDCYLSDPRRFVPGLTHE